MEAGKRLEERSKEPGEGKISRRRKIGRSVRGWRNNEKGYNEVGGKRRGAAPREGMLNG